MTVFFLFVLAVVILGFWTGFIPRILDLVLKPFRLKRELRETPLYRIGGLPENVVGRIAGKAQALATPFAAPFSRRACVYYTACAQEERTRTVSETTTDAFGQEVRRDRDESYWSTIAEETRHGDIVLDDGSGRAIIDPSHAEVLLETDYSYGEGSMHEQFLLRNGTASQHHRGRLRFCESLIEVGETIACKGAGTREPDPERAPTGYRDELPTRIRIGGSVERPLIISDDPSTTT